MTTTENEQLITQSINSATENNILSVLLEIRELNDKVKKLWVREVMEQTQLPAEIIEPIVEKSFIKKRLNRPLLEGEIKHAINKTKTMEQAAEYIGVHFDTFKKYCQLYDEKNRTDNREDLLLWKPTRGSKTVKKKNV